MKIEIVNSKIYVNSLKSNLKNKALISFSLTVLTLMIRNFRDREEDIGSIDQKDRFLWSLIATIFKI